MLGKEELLSKQIVVKQEIAKKQVGDYIIEFIKNYCVYLFDSITVPNE